MPILFKSLAKSALSATPTDYYTVPAATKTRVETITLCNTHASTTRTITLLLGTKHLLDEYALAAKETLSLTVPHLLEAAETLRASQDTGTDVDLIASGVEIT